MNDLNKSEFRNAMMNGVFFVSYESIGVNN